MSLSEKDEADYVGSPYHCPYCKSMHITSGHFEPEGNYMPVSCEDCGREWKDIYELVGMEECPCDS